MSGSPFPRAVVMQGGQLLAVHELQPGSELVIGRSEGCQVPIADSSVSRMHARLYADEHGVYLEDLGSANGTFLDGERVHGRMQLTDGQQVRVAQKALSAPIVVRYEEVGATVTELPASALGDLPPAHGDDAGLPPFSRGAVASRPPASRQPPIAAGQQTLAAAAPLASLSSAPGRPRRRAWPWVVLGGAALLAIAAAAAVGVWLLLRPAAASRGGQVATTTTASAVPTPQAAAAPAAPIAPPAAPVTLPEEAPPTTTPSEAPSDAFASVPAPPTPAMPESTEPTMAPAEPSPPPAGPPPTLTGKWTVRLENLFYPEDDYVIELQLDLHQRGSTLSGVAQAAIEGKTMTLRVPSAAVTGSTRRAGPEVKLHLPFDRPLGELDLEGAAQEDGLAGTFRSSLLKKPGSWQAVRQ